MPISLTLTDKAQDNLDDAFQWYEEQDPGLGKEFIRCVDAKIANLNRHPLNHPIVQNEHVRRVLVNRFPFSIYFVKEKEMITSSSKKKSRVLEVENIAPET